MSLFALADRLFDVRRLTALICDTQAAAASFTVARQPVRASRMKVHVYGGTANTGTVTITGTVDGTPGTAETLTFTSAGYQTTVRSFTAISSITSSGLDNEAAVPNVTVSAVGSDGAPQNGSMSLHTSYPALFRRAIKEDEWNMSEAGTAAAMRGTLVVPWTDVFQPRNGDVWQDVISGEEFVVIGAPVVRGRLRARAWTLNVVQRAGTA